MKFAYKKIMAALPNFLHFLTVDEAARKYGLDLSRLHDLIERGKIRAGVIAGETIVSGEEVIEKLQREAEKAQRAAEKAQRAETSGLRKEDLPEYRMHADLKGKGIWIAKASREYGIPHPTILKWVRLGIIRVIGREANKVLIDEADIAYCSEIYKKFGKPGRILFNPDGTPYKPKTRSLSL